MDKGGCKILDKLKAGPFTYIMRWVKKTDDDRKGILDGYAGRSDHEAGKIYLDIDLGQGYPQETMAHEFCHVLWRLAGLYHEGPKKEEEIIRRIAPWLIVVLRDNPELVKFLVSEGDCEPPA